MAGDDGRIEHISAEVDRELQHSLGSLCLDQGELTVHGGSSTDSAETEVVTGDENVCPICLDCPKLEDVAIVKGCEHTYCVKCILQWAVHKEKAWCPQCKASFTHLYTYFALDGTLLDYPTEESVCLLKRAVWFQDGLKGLEKGKNAKHVYEEWDDYARFYEEYDEDQEVEDFYFSAAAGSARIVIGNRRWGTGGYVSSGRKQARPVPPASKAVKGKATPSKASDLESPSVQTPPQKAKLTQSSSSSGSSSGMSQKQGRRARRNARRAYVDDDYD